MGALLKMSSKYSRRVRPQGTPPICVHKRVRMFTLPTPVLTYNAWLHFHGVTAQLVRLDIDEAPILRQNSADPTLYEVTIKNDCWTLQFGFWFLDLGQRFAAIMTIWDRTVFAGLAETGNLDFVGTDPYDTWNVKMPVQHGAGDAQFRVMT